MKNLMLFFALLISLPAAIGQNEFNASEFFNQADAFFQEYVSGTAVDYNRIKDNPQKLQELVEQVGTAKLNGLDAKTTQAFLINAYNILVIDGVRQNYPLNSVLDVAGFFDGKKKTVAGRNYTLNQLEKDLLLKEYGDPRFHFVLVCAAIDCPPIANFAYRPENLEAQLETRTIKALNDPNFIQVDNASKKVSISQIFQWYGSDFGGGKKAAVEYINKYRKTVIPAEFSIDFYNYNWKLNEDDQRTGNIKEKKGNNASRYVVSAAIPKGTTETKIFNNLYTQQSGGDGMRTDRSTFFTTSLSFLYGVTGRFNAGFDVRYRRVRNDALPSSVLDVFNTNGALSSRAGITTIGPKIRWAPFEALPNFSLQSAYWFPLEDNLEGDSNEPFIDWNGATWWTQFFNDFTIGNNFSVFTEVDFLWEDIGNAEEGALNRVSTPATLIVSYFPNPKTTLYTLGSYSPFWQENFDYFAQAGLGAKYQFTPNFELEFLYTAFTNDFLQSVNGSAATFNIGVRITTR